MGEPAGPAPRRARPGRARVSPEALAAARGGVREGLDWLGRPPETNAGLLVRAFAALARFLLFVVFRFRVLTSGQEHLPSDGGYLVVAAIHRGWMDPFLILHALPLEPRAWFLGSGPSAFSARWREWLLHRLGGMLPVWRGGVGVDQHVASARAVLENGGVFVLVPEGGIAGPPDHLAPFRTGAALIALRTGAPIVPIALAGAHELYLGKRMASRILPSTNARDLLGDAWDGALPEPGSRLELDLARRLTERFAEVLGPAVAAIFPGTVDPPERPRRLRGLTWLLLSRRGR
ncbi:MAG TPA: lysophospholipid acyltransferase family protein [Candidatus Sulfomarinibacteraceae bacterium]|nr:lysophospholipid acyltransferase family protein [Candidatus Sulfomarinibacteraceae bacterium]